MPDDSAVATASLPTASVSGGSAALMASAAGRRAARTAALLEAPILPTLLMLAAPNVALVLAQTAVSVADTWFVGRLGTEALAGLALVFPMLMLMQMMSAGAMGGGVSSAVARALGANDTARAEALAIHALVIATGMAALFTIVMLVFGPVFFRWLGGEGAALEQACAYSGVLFAGAAGVWYSNTLASVLRGTGNMRFPSVVLVAAAAGQVPLAGALVLGWGPFLALGIVGAATATVASFGTASVVMLGYLLGGRAGLRLGLRVRLGGALFFDILRVGAVACLSALQTSLTIVIVTGLVGRFGGAALAGYGLGCACGSSGGRPAGPVSESGGYVTVTAPTDGATAAAGCSCCLRSLLRRVTVDPNVCGGKPCIRGTRIYIAIILDALAEGLTTEEIIDHYPHLAVDDVRAALAYAAELARENVWKIATVS